MKHQPLWFDFNPDGSIRETSYEHPKGPPMCNGVWTCYVPARVRVIDLEEEIQNMRVAAYNATTAEIQSNREKNAEIEAMRKLLCEAADYLDINKMTSIGAGSKLHKKFREMAEITV
jgi:hypothetical protein